LLAVLRSDGSDREAVYRGFSCSCGGHSGSKELPSLR
jgi:hypothetical protein